MAKFAEFSIGELQALWSCTLGSARSVSKARKLSLGDWVFWDSRVGDDLLEADDFIRHILFPCSLGPGGCLNVHLSSVQGAGGEERASRPRHR